MYDKIHYKISRRYRKLFTIIISSAVFSIVHVTYLVSIHYTRVLKLFVHAIAFLFRG